MSVFLFRLQTRDFFRNRLLAWTLFLGVLAVSIFLFYFLITPAGLGDPLAPVNFQMVFTGVTPLVNLLLFVIFSSVAYESSRKIFLSGRMEVLKIRRGGVLRITLYQVALFMCLSALFFLIISAGLYLCARSANLNSNEIINLLIFNLLTMGITILVAPMIGFFLASSMSRSKAYATLFVLLALLSPLSLAILQPLRDLLDSGGLIKVSQAVQYLFVEPFRIATPAERPELDLISLLPSEKYRALLALVWIIPTFVGYFLSTKKTKGAGVVSFLATFLLLSLAWGFGSTFVSLPRWMFAEDVNNISDVNFLHQTKVLPSKPIKNLPAIKQYKMDFFVRGNLRAKVQIQFVGPIPEKSFFTLYRGYRIVSIIDEEGKHLKYSRRGDYVELNTHNATCKQITFSYFGTGGGNYSNEQGICLPATFPYYPWPDAQKYVDNRVLVGNNSHSDNFLIKVDSPFASVITENAVNVESDNYVTLGEYPPTLLAGELAKMQLPDSKYVISGFRVSEVRGTSLNPANYQKALKRANQYRKFLGLDNKPKGSNLSIVLLPTNARFSNLYLLPFYERDHVLLSDSAGIDENVVCALYTLRDLQQTRKVDAISVGLWEYLCDPKTFAKELEGRVPTNENDPLALIIASSIERKGVQKTFAEIGKFILNTSSLDTNALSKTLCGE